MNVLHLLSSLPWVERLGWTLVHFIWQGFAIATVYGVARRARSGLAGIALAAMLAAPAVTWSLMSQADRVPNSAQVSRARAVVDSRTRATSIVIAAPSAEPQSVMTWVVALWLAGSVTSWARLAMGLLGTARLRSTLVRPAPPEWQRRLRELGERIQVTRPVRLLASAIAQSPCVVGWIRPVVLVPVGMLAGLPAEQVEALLLHELAHVRRHDYLINILQSVAEALLFYNRAVWWVSGHIRTEREQCCDNIAAAASGDVPTYARALAVLESWRPSHALAATGGSLPDRIARLLAQPRSALSRRSAAGAVVTALLLIVPLCILSGQSEPARKFEVASIKLATGDRRLIRITALPGGRLTTENSNVRLLLQNAYGLQPYQVSGGPNWTQTDGYDVEAKGDATANRAQVLLMLRGLLEDRFQLKFHRENRELPVYTLSAAKSGPKLPHPKEGGCVVPEPGAPPPPPREGQLPCGRGVIMMETSGARIAGARLPMSEFIRVLAITLGRPVIDKTGFAESFDVTLDFAPDHATSGLPYPTGPAGDSAVAPPAADPSSPPSIIVALQEQLGLKLDSTKGPVEVLVIDHVERPSAN